MLSAKQSQKHGMKREKWITREKMSQYRAILKLHARDKNLQTKNADKLKKNATNTLKSLREDIRYYREIVNDSVYGDKRRINGLVQKEKDFKLLLADAEPKEAYNVVFQDYNLKRKQLDRLLFIKEKKRAEFCNLRSQHTLLSNEIAHPPKITETENQHLRRQQELISRYQGALAKHHAANSIFETYNDILVILRKDSKYFDVVLNELQKDRNDQCRVIFKTTMIGQMAAENLDDIRIKYQKMVKDVWLNMKEREKNLDVARLRAEDIWEYAKSLVRVESDTNLFKKRKKSQTNVDLVLERQSQRLEQIFSKMKDSMLIQSFEELFSRLEDQIKQKEKLSELYKHTLRDRDFMLNKKNHAETALRNLEHSVIATTTRYKSEKKTMYERIKHEKQRYEETNALIESRGKLLMKIRAALQSMSSMMVCVRVTRSSMPVSKAGLQAAEDRARQLKECKKLQGEEESEEEEGEEKQTKRMCDDVIENEGLAVLAQVVQKATTLFMNTSFELDKGKIEVAKDAYENYVSDYYSKLKFGEEEEITGGMYLVEHEAVDPNVLTRSDIKMKSKQIVEINTRED